MMYFVLKGQQIIGKVQKMAIEGNTGAEFFNTEVHGVLTRRCTEF